MLHVLVGTRKWYKVLPQLQAGTCSTGSTGTKLNFNDNFYCKQPKPNIIGYQVETVSAETHGQTEISPLCVQFTYFVQDTHKNTQSSNGKVPFYEDITLKTNETDSSCFQIAAILKAEQQKAQQIKLSGNEGRRNKQGNMSHIAMMPRHSTCGGLMAAGEVGQGM
jgi:hypothetical protein